MQGGSQKSMDGSCSSGRYAVMFLAEEGFFEFNVPIGSGRRGPKDLLRRFGWLVGCRIFWHSLTWSVRECAAKGCFFV